MFATRHDQENLINEHQTVAASKPLNQGTVRGSRLAPKTPGAKGYDITTLKGRPTAKKGWNDSENDVPFNKAAKGGKLNFVTPVAGRDRAPLGAKTTNVKAKGLQTPAPATLGQGLQKTQRRSASARKPKLKIHQSDTVTADAKTLHTDESESEPEIEYCPPKVQEMPNYPDYHNDFAFLGNSRLGQMPLSELFGGWLANRREENAEAEAKRDAEAYAARGRELDREIEAAVAQCEEMSLETIRQKVNPTLMSSVGSNKTANASRGTVKPLQSKKLSSSSSFNARMAAEALSQQSIPRFAAPTSATVAKRTAVLPSAHRTTTGPAASRATIGYAAGRRVSGSSKVPSRTGHGLGSNSLKRGQASASRLKWPSTAADESKEEENGRSSLEDLFVPDFEADDLDLVDLYGHVNLSQDSEADSDVEQYKL